MTTTVAEPNGLRPFAPHTDLAQLADLIEAAFGAELRRTGNRLAEDMRALAALGPLVGLAAGSWPLYHGRVWLEGGRIIGNVSYGRERAREEWQISNVAVYPEYRGRGIAGRLLDSALADIRQLGGRRVYLQVNVDNVAAQHLYLRRGFDVYDTVLELGLWPRHGAAIGQASDRVEPVPWWHTRRTVDLARQALPPHRLQARPHLLDQYRRGLWGRLSRAFWLDLFDGSCEGAVNENGHMVALGRMWGISPRGPLEVELLVHPAQRGRWEAELTLALLYQQGERIRQMRSHVSTAHPEAAQALLANEFELLRTLDEMVLVL
ncbi:MAG: GNAT family N-acetyltransferase [Anaerolineae bacterium]|jgi:ribosomal protein S18 acetylase RimI-like enzyme